MLLAIVSCLDECLDLMNFFLVVLTHVYFLSCVRLVML